MKAPHEAAPTKNYDYGIRFDGQLNPLELELYCFRRSFKGDWKGSLGKVGHFREICSILWGARHEEVYGSKAVKTFNWNPWVEVSIEKACEHRYLAVLGCANSSKTFTFAAWGIVNWLAFPTETMVLMTSTSLKESRKRMWGAVAELFTSTNGLPGKLVDSDGVIRSQTIVGGFTEKQGITLIAGEKKKERESIGKLIGMKSPRVIVVADELPELSESLISAAISNLSVNPYFQFIGIGNFSSIYDPLGRLSKPKDGWGSITPEDDQWETELGYCIRFDGLKSPNLTRGEDVWPEIYNSKNLFEHKRNLGGENTALFWRMCRSFPCPEGDSNVIYSESDFIRGAVHDEPVWDTIPTKIAGIDPSFSQGGDRFAVAIGMCGRNKNGKVSVAFDRIEILHEDVTLRDKPRDIQMAEQVIKILKQENIDPRNVGVDASGPGGIAFTSILSHLWKTSDLLGVKFGARASDRKVSTTDMRKGNEAYVDRRSEVWYSAREPMRSGLIKNVPTEMAHEMRAVRYETRKNGANILIQVEPKDKMKKRIGKSPDLADAGMIMIDVARQRHGFDLEIGSTNDRMPGVESFSSLVKKANQVYLGANYSESCY